MRMKIKFQGEESYNEIDMPFWDFFKAFFLCYLVLFGIMFVIGFFIGVMSALTV